MARPNGGDAPLVLEISSAAGIGSGGAVGRGLTLDLAAPGGATALLHLGTFQQGKSGTSLSRCALRLPIGVHGPLARATVQMAVDRILHDLIATQAAPPVLLRVDYAGLGMTRRDYSCLENQISGLLESYGARSGKPALMLGELGFVRGYTDANMALEPDTSSRVDVMVPKGRRSPILLNLTQHDAGGPRIPISIELRAPDGNTKELRYDRFGEAVEHLSGFGKMCAVIAPPEMRNDHPGGLTHAIAFAPTQPGATLCGCPAQAGIWELTVTNTGPTSTALSVFFDDPMPLLPHWQSPRATLRRSRCRDVQPDMDEFIRPDFYNFRNRCDALLRHAGYVPPRIIRRHADPIAWPLVSVSRNTQLTRMVFNRSVGVAQPTLADDRLPCNEQGLAAVVPLQGSNDTLIESFLEALRDGAPETIEDRIGAVLESTSA